MSHLNFNVANDPGDDQPVLISDNPEGGTFLTGHFEGVPGETPNRYVADVPPEITGGAWFTFDHGRQRLRVIVPPGPGDWEAGEPPCQPPEDPPIAMVYGKPPATARPGIVRLVGRSFVDDDGPFYPLVTSLFWALGAWMKGGSEQDRVKRNLAFVAAQGFDGVRVFYYVDWTAQPYGGLIAGTPEALAAFLDCAYNEFGLRVKVTVQAGAPDPVSLGHQVVSAVLPRRHTVIMLEGTNETWASTEDGVALGKVLMEAGVPASVGFGNLGGAEGDELGPLKRMGDEAGCNVDTLHLERQGGSTRQNRQCWNFHAFYRASDNGEPVGPASSVESQDNPFSLATDRAGSCICGGELYCLHTGSGVYGVTYQSSAGMRYANLDEIPNIVAIMAAIRGADASVHFLGVGNWYHTNNPIPMEFQQNLDKQYFAINGHEFVAILTGVTGPLGAPKFNTNVTGWAVYDPTTGGAVQPDGQLIAYVLRGTTAEVTGYKTGHVRRG